MQDFFEFTPVNLQPCTREPDLRQARNDDQSRDNADGSSPKPSLLGHFYCLVQGLGFGV